MRQQRIHMRQPIQRKPNHDKRHHLINKGPVRHHHGAVRLGLVERVVAAAGRGGVVVGAGAQDGEFLFDVFVDGEDDGDGGHEDCADEGFDEVGEGGGDAVK